jgi:twinkle protein
LDKDEPGRLATDAIIKRLGADRCRLLELPDPYKDANEALLGGVTPEQIRDLMASAKGRDPEELKSSLVFLDKVIEVFEGEEQGRPPVGVKSPWSSVGRHLMFRAGEVTLWGGYSGSGKSAITNHVAACALANDTRWCIASMEMPPSRTLHRLILQLMGVKPTIAQVREVMGWLGDKLWMFNVMGTSKADRMLEVFEYAARRYDIRHYVVDSLAKCGIDEDDFTGQKRFVESLTDFAAKHDAHLHLVAHARKGNDGESDHRPGKHDVRGATAITDMVHNVITIWRDREAEQQTHRNRVVAEVCKQRNHTWENAFDLDFQPDTFRYLDQPDQPLSAYWPPVDSSAPLDKPI